MFDLLVQLAGQGVSPVQTKPENTAKGNGDAPDNAVFGDILSKASEARQGGAPEKTEPVFNTASTVGVTASGKEDAGEKAKGTELAAQVQEQLGLSVQLPEQADEKADLPENAVAENTAETDLENANDADVNTQPDVLKNSGPQANGLNGHSSARAHEVISALQNKNPLPEEQGTLAGNDASVDNTDDASQDVSVTVNANGTDATGLTDGTDPENTSEHETASWEQPVAQDIPQNAGQSEKTAEPAEAVKAAAAYHPVFEAPRNNLGKTEGDYASRPERPSLNNGKPVLQTGLLQQVKPQQAEANASASSALQQQAADLQQQLSRQAPQSEQPVETFKPVEITFAAGSVQPVNQLKDARPANNNAAVPEGHGFDANFDTALSAQADMNDNAGMDLGGKAFDSLKSAGGDNVAETSAENAELFESVSVESVSVDNVATPDGASVNGLSQSALAAGVKAPDSVIPVFTSSAHSVADQVVEATQYGVQNGQKSLVLKLNPDNLGDVRLHLSSNVQQEVSAKLIVSSFETHDALNQQINSLKQSLENQGLQVGKISVVMAGGSEFGANAGNHGQQQHNATGQDNAQNNFWSSMNQQQQQGSFNQNAQQMFNQMMNNSSGGGLSYGGYGNASGSLQQAAADSISTPQENADAAWGTPHDNGRVSLLV